MTKTRRCPICEQGTVRPVATRAAMPYRHVTALEPAWEVRIPTCDNCHERLIDGNTARSLDAALEAALQTLQTQLVNEAIDQLATVKTQRQWEKRLGLSPGYLSRLKSGKEGSVVLTTLLSLLAQAPSRQWKQTEAIWSGRDQAAAEVLSFPARGATIASTFHFQQEASSQSASVSQLRDSQCVVARFEEAA